MKTYKPQSATTVEYPTAEQARNNTFTRAGAILLAVAASAAVLAGCGEKPVDEVGNIAVPTSTATTTAESAPMTPGESLVDVGGDPTVTQESLPLPQGAVTTTEFPVTRLGTYHIPDEEDTTAAEVRVTTAGSSAVTE